jgi:hypothetical protein
LCSIADAPSGSHQSLAIDPKCAASDSTTLDVGVRDKPTTLDVGVPTELRILVSLIRPF